MTSLSQSQERILALVHAPAVAIHDLPLERTVLVSKTTGEPFSVWPVTKPTGTQLGVYAYSPAGSSFARFVGHCTGAELCDAFRLLTTEEAREAAHLAAQAPRLVRLH